LPADAFSVESLGALYRLRWQIEVAFKRMKSLLRIDRLPAKDNALALGLAACPSALRAPR
jgi:IS4 transposase